MFIGFSAYAEYDKIYTYKYWKSATLEDVKRDIHDGIDINKFKNEKYRDRNIFIYSVMATKDPRIVQYLIDKGANLEIRTKRNWTPLLIASAYAQTPEIIDVLIENGVDKNVVTAGHRLNALMLAAVWQRNPEIITKLIEVGFDVNERGGQWNRTPLMWAGTNDDVRGNTNMLLLIKHGADIDLKDDNGAKAWHLIRGKSYFEHTDIYKYLQKHTKKN